MGERSAEFLPPAQLTSESGYSETESAKVIEGSMQDVKSQKKRSPMQNVSRREKIITAYRANTEKILQCMRAAYELNGANSRQEEQLMEEVKMLRHVQDELLNALLLEQKGLLAQESISKEAWNLIQ